MSAGIFQVPKPGNEPNYTYAPGTPEREKLQHAISACYNEERTIPMFIGGKEVSSGEQVEIFPPHKLDQRIGIYYKGGEKEIKQAIDASLKARKDWAGWPWEERLAVFLKAADLMAGPYRYKLNAATIVGQSKNPYQAEIDSAAELIDFLRFNAYYATQIYSDQPDSGPNTWNRNEFRPLEGFIWAVTPFNFTSISGNLPSAPAMMGNVVVWKPSKNQVYSAQVIMEIFRKAGLPDGVINMVPANPAVMSDIIFQHPDFAGVHFTGSTKVLRGMWKKMGDNIENYRTYPRIVGESGGKDFLIMHESADLDATVAALIRGAFEYQGQKCSAISRAYIPSNRWEDLQGKFFEEIQSVKMGDPADFTNFFNAVIDEKAFDKLKGYIDRARQDSDAEILIGGNCDNTKGYFIEPTVILAKKPDYVTMCEELFGPVLTVYIYDENKYSQTLDLVDQTSPYGLTGGVMAEDKEAARLASKKLVNAAGNFYVNDKPTGAVVGQQPFGGARASGTNDKAGSYLNLVRWISMRTIKENFVPAKNYRYPFMGE